MIIKGENSGHNTNEILDLLVLQKNFKELGSWISYNL